MEMFLKLKSLEFIALIKGLLKFKSKEDELLLFSYLSSNQSLLVSLSSKPEKIVFSLRVEETSFLCDLNFTFNLNDFSRITKLKKKEAKEFLEINENGISIVDSTLSFKLSILESNVQLSILQSSEYALDLNYVSSIKNVLKCQKDLVYLQVLANTTKTYIIFVGIYQITLVEIEGVVGGFESKPFLINSTTLNSLLAINDEIIFVNNWLVSASFAIDLSLVEVKPNQSYIFEPEFIDYLLELNLGNPTSIEIDVSKDIESAMFVDPEYKLCKLNFEEKKLEFIKSGEVVSSVPDFITSDLDLEPIFIRVDNLLPTLKISGVTSIQYVEDAKPLLVTLDQNTKSYIMPSVVLEQ
jgi:hypothetical protein